MKRAATQSLKCPECGAGLKEPYIRCEFCGINLKDNRTGFDKSTAREHFNESSIKDPEKAEEVSLKLNVIIGIISGIVVFLLLSIGSVGFFSTIFLAFLAMIAGFFYEVTLKYAIAYAILLGSFRALLYIYDFLSK